MRPRGHPALFHRLAAPLHVLQDERREVGFLPSLRGGEPVRHRSNVLVQPPGGGLAPAGWGAPFGKGLQRKVGSLLSANQQRKRLPSGEEVRRKLGILQFANSLEVNDSRSEVYTQEISRGMGADVAATSVHQTPLASLIFLNSRERENKVLFWERNGLVTRHRGHCAYTRTASSPHRAREHRSPRCTSRRHASVRDLAHVKHAASRHRERVPIDFASVN